MERADTQTKARADRHARDYLTRSERVVRVRKRCWLADW